MLCDLTSVFPRLHCSEQRPASSKTNVTPARVALLVAVFASQMAWSAPTPSLHAKIEAALEQKLPAPDRFIQHWQGTSADVSRLLVADFDQTGFDKANYGAAIGVVWRFDLSQHPAKIYSADVNGFYTDVRLEERGRANVRGANAARRAAQRLGMSYWLTGSISEEPGKRALIAVTGGRLADDLRATETWSGTRDEIFKGLRISCNKVLRTLAFPEIDVACGVGKNSSVADLDDLALWHEKTLRLKGDAWSDEARAIYVSRPTFGPAQLIKSRAWTTGFYRDEDNASYDRFVTEHAGNVTLQRWGHHRLAETLETSLGARHLKTLAAMVVAAPGNPQPYIDLASALAGTRYLYMPSQGKPGEMWYVAPSSRDPPRDPHPPYVAAVVVAAEAARRWPDNYRVQWALASALNTIASNLRGTRLWKDLPPDTQRRFMALRKLSNEALDRAISQQPFVADLWKIRLDHVGGDAEAMMEVFRRAVALAPNDAMIYTTAMNYANPQWGGTRKMREEIYQTARARNPDAAWVDDMRKNWAQN